MIPTQELLSAVTSKPPPPLRGPSSKLPPPPGDANLETTLALQHKNLADAPLVVSCLPACVHSQSGASKICTHLPLSPHVLSRAPPLPAQSRKDNFGSHKSFTVTSCPSSRLSTAACHVPRVAASLPLVAPSPTHGYHARPAQVITSAAKARLLLCLGLLLPQSVSTVTINTEPSGPSTRRTCQADKERVDCSMLLLFLTLRCSSCLRVSAAACIFVQ